MRSTLGCLSIKAEITPNEPDLDDTSVGSVDEGFFMLETPRVHVLNIIPYMKKFLVSSVLCLLSASLFAQIHLSGVVLSKDKIGLPEAILALEGTNYQIQTDRNGRFDFTRLQPGKYNLICKYLGYQPYQLSLAFTRDTSISINMQPSIFQTQEVNINSTRVNVNSGMAYSGLDKLTLQQSNLGQDVPYLLQHLPSVVVSSDAGTGIGYTGIRIRGSDPSRINVSVNGIPINDAESQQTYWVDLPDIISSTENIQVQRGVGTSVNGAGSFGGSINLQSDQLSSEAFASSSNSFGSFNSIKNTINFGSGLLNTHWIFEGRLSRIKSDGFVDRGNANLKSYSISTGYTNKNTVLRLNIFSGKEITYQSWNGIPESRYKNDKKGMQEYIVRNGLDSVESANLLNSGITYNYFTYDNQVDDYQQDHYQFLVSQKLNEKWVVNTAFHFTHGKGFYEEYKKNQTLANYGISNPDSTLMSSDLIRRKWLDNDFYGVTYSLVGNIRNAITTTLAGGWNRYEGLHYGEVIWARNAGNAEIRHRYYDDKATKNDFNIYSKSEIKFTSSFVAFIDLQFRNVTYKFMGLDSSGNSKLQDVNLNFFNPKAGLTYTINSNQQVYGSVAVANKEPNRDDYIESTINSRPKAESLTDFEAGYRFQKSYFHCTANLYFMNYKNQLVLTGAVNDVGNYTRTNTTKSYRKGIEIEASYAINKKFNVDGNVTISENKISQFDEYLDSYDVNFNYNGQVKTSYHKSQIAFSPSVIYMGRLSYNPVKNLQVQFILKYVGKQYLDNTTNEKRSLDAYHICDIKLNYSIKNVIGKEIAFNLLANNIFSEIYASNGYTYGYNVGVDRTDENFYYPQAKINFLGQVTLRF